jgi:TonB-linked SusC/RagA family outer membrane protein
MRKLLLLLFLLLNGIMNVSAQQTRQITGLVTDKDNSGSLPGVVVSLKGTTKATQTDLSGKYKLTIPAGKPVVLVFRFVGYKLSEVVVNDQSVVDVALQSDNIQLQGVDVVSIGYSTVKRRDLTGSISSLSGKELADNPINSAAEILNGRLAGVEVTSAEGAPGADVRIRIRGVGSLTQDASPLYIIDGIQVENGLNNISPQDIESIDVLKDASATSIYGARGSNGVVIVTTKGGKVMKTKIAYNGMFGVNVLPRELPVMSPYDFVIYQYELNPTLPGATVPTSFQTAYGSTWDTLSVYKNTPAIDWQKKVLGIHAPYQTHNISITGGTKATQFNISFTNNDQKGIALNSSLTRQILNLRFDHNVSDNLKAGFNVMFNNQTILGSGTSDAGASQFNNLRNVVKYIPFTRKNDKYGEDDFNPDYLAETNIGLSLDLTDPVALINAQYKRSNTKFSTYSGYLNYTFFKYFAIRSTLGVNYSTALNQTFEDYFTSRARSQGAGLPLVTVGTTTGFSLNNSNVLTFTRLINKHSINVLLGEEIYNTQSSQLLNSLKFFPKGITSDKALGQLTLGTNQDQFPRNSAAESRILSGFTRVNYSYNDRYLFTFSLRADGSSKFAENKRVGYFPSGAFAWRISQEDFMKKITVISDMKLRLSIGQSGNNRIGDYLFQTQFGSAEHYDLNGVVTPGYTSSTLPNANLKWETTTARNLGLDLGLFNGRLQVTVDAYSNTTDNLLVNAPVPIITGYTTQLQNIGSISNKGLEFQVNGNIVKSRDFAYSANFNLSFNRNKIVKLAEDQTYFYQWAGVGNPNSDPADYIVKVGQPIGTMYGYQVDGNGKGSGFYRVEDFNYNAATQTYTLKAGVANDQSATGVVPQPGSLKLKDLSGDGFVDAANDRTVLGNATPKFEGGLNQQFNYKQFDLSVFVSFAYGQSVYNANKSEFTNGVPSTNMLADMAGRWRTVDDKGNVLQKIVSSAVVGVPPDQLAAFNQNAQIWRPLVTWAPNSWSVEDGSYLRLSNISLGYTLPAKLVSKVKLSQVRFYGSVNNVAIITGYSGYDPQVNTRSSSPLTPNVDYSAYPRSRTFVFGVNVSL